VPGPAYTRLRLDERRGQLLAAGRGLFAEHAYEEISMRQVAEAAGVSKALLYHYFPSKTELFKAAVADAAGELAAAIAPSGTGTAFEQLEESLDAYLRWIEANARTWTQLMRSAVTVPEAAELIGAFREQTLRAALQELAPGGPSPALRTALRGWLGFLDAAILDWTEHRDFPRSELQAQLLAAFGAALSAAG
jgi:AcrR family transcriptional regulator